MSALLNRQFLIRNLCFMYRLMVASAPLLEFSIKRSKGSLRAYYKKHLAEETGHDRMVAEDLTSLGVKEIPYDHTAASLAGSQYYLIAHHHPSMLLGYMGVLESSPLSLESIEEIEKTHGCRMGAVRLHAEHDPHHASEIQRMVDGLSKEEQQAVAWNAVNVRSTLQAEFKRWLDDVSDERIFHAGTI